MSIESIKNFFKNIFETLYYKIKDSASFNILLEKYEHLDLHHQVWIRRSVFVVSLLLILSFPFSLFISSLNSTKEFQLKKQLINTLITSKSQTFSIRGITPTQLTQQISTIIDRLTLSEEQTVSIAPFNSSSLKLPANLKILKHSGTQIQISGVNIEEVIEIGNHLSNIDPSVKLIQLKIKELQNKKKYYSVTYSLLHFIEPLSNKNPVISLKKPA